MDPQRRHLIAALAAGAGLQGHAQAVLRLGLAPFLSPAALLATFRPVREHLERALAQPVEAVTARDFVALAQAVQRGDYEIALLPAHMARLAVADWGWAPLARTVNAAEVQLLVRADGPVKAAAELRGRRLGMLDLHSLSAAVAVQWLRNQAPPLSDVVEIVTMPSVNSALFALARDEVHAVVATATQLMTLPEATPRNFRSLAVLSDIPGPWYVARFGIPAPTLARWRAALHSFVPDAARPVSASNSRLTPLAVADTEALEPYAAHLRRQLGTR